MATFSAEAAAKFLADDHANGSQYKNLSDSLAPRTIEEAYDVQEALRDLWLPSRGQIAGLKIATTTKVMQDLMGIDHPCGGMIFANTIHSASANLPATLKAADYIHPVIECELAVRMARDLPLRDKPYSPEDARAAVGTVMAAYEIIEDRHAVYAECEVRTLIADNAWNGGIVIGPEQIVSASMDLNGLTGRLTKNGAISNEGKTDDPMGALAWVANLAASRGRPLKADMVVITGSLLPTFGLEPNDHILFEIEGVGQTELIFKDA